MKLVIKLMMLTLVSTILVNCAESEIPENCIDDVCIVGEWTWVQSYGSIAGTTITPQTEMETRKLIIDDTNYREYVDDVLILESDYEYVKTDELSGFTNDSLVLKLGIGTWYAVFEEEENLILSEPCFDCWTHTYSRN